MQRLTKQLTSALLGSIGLFTLLLATGPAQADTALWEALAEGGVVVMLRHTEAEDDDMDRSLRLTSPRDCSQEANLTDTGRAQAESLGAALRARGVEVAGVLHGEFCRTLQTAEAAFGQGEGWNALNLLNTIPGDEVDFLMEDVNERIADFTGPGVLFLVTHRPNINLITYQNVEPGDMVLLKGDGMMGFERLGVLPMSSWLK